MSINGHSSVCVVEFCVNVNTDQSVQMPRGAEIVKVDTNGHDLIVYAIVDPEAELVERQFMFVYRDTPFNPRNTFYVDSFFVYGLQYHMFEIR